MNKYVHHRLLYHVVWSVKDRQPLIVPDIKRPLYEMLTVEIRKNCIQLIELGGIEDHTHVLMRCAPNHYIPKILKQIKGSSSHFVNHDIKPDFYFQWQRGYGIFSISRWDLNKIRNYIKNQKEHHDLHTIIEDLEKYCEEDDGY